jgi:GNAT superfamily N-acetyltransferase
MIIMTDLMIREFVPEDQASFESLNREWIEAFFRMEPIDEQVLQNPIDNIISNGGYILMAELTGEVIGTVALKRLTADVFEFTKMAVDGKYRGKGIGKALGEAAITKALRCGASSVILYSNSKLRPAISLYEKLGFHFVPVDAMYERSDIKMQLDLQTAPVTR